MGAVVLQAFTTLDGVVQGGGAPDEDREGNFEHGGWALDYDAQNDKLGEVEKIVNDWESKTEALLLGRKTYEIFAASWGVWDENAKGQQGAITRLYNRVPKYVASRSLQTLGWKNAQLLGPNAPAAVAQLRVSVRGEIRMWGSTRLVKTLAEHDLIDEYRLAVYPLVLGTGKRLFSDGYKLSKLVLVSSSTLQSGVVVNTYRRASGR